jgi:hypothetical protein
LRRFLLPLAQAAMDPINNLPGTLVDDILACVSTSLPDAAAASCACVAWSEMKLLCRHLPGTPWVSDATAAQVCGLLGAGLHRFRCVWGLCVATAARREAQQPNPTPADGLCSPPAPCLSPTARCPRSRSLTAKLKHRRSWQVSWRSSACSACASCKSSAWTRPASWSSCRPSCRCARVSATACVIQATADTCVCE